ncbi:hypothetical protein LADH09A_004893 [Micromonospora sp. LAH09]|uniref:zinc finger domain-containing protein n=1 Tax=Micromonospora cabrerizensis TaxID=2911213 RepID=UPI001EE85D56|nr:hypothetical protein [Micromonospora cabrerizensis]MCG5470921.1 hypothetical protein [Micromonospora cabrerizensis]
MRIRVEEPRAAERFWEGMREVAAAAARHQDPDLYHSIVKIGRAALAQGVELVPSSGQFLECPVCEVLPGQRCVNVPKHPLEDNVLHVERTELAEKALRGEIPFPIPLR